MTEADHKLAAQRFLGRSWSQGPDGQQPEEWLALMQQYLDALVALDALTADGAAVWHEQMRVAASDDGRTLDAWAPAVRARMERALDQMPARVEVMSTEGQRFSARLGALQALGALSQDELRAWAERYGARVVAPSGPPPPVDERREREMRAWAEAVTGELVRVIPGPVARAAGLRIASVELYEGAIGVRWHFLSPDGSWPTRSARVGSGLCLSDDYDTEYFRGGGGGEVVGKVHDGSAVIIGQDNFVPRPPREARRVIATRGEHRFVIDLSSRA